jgi:hypothetical protein
MKVRKVIMKSRGIVTAALIICFIVVVLVGASHAVSRTGLWPKMCASCHDGKTAVSKEAIRDKYRTVDAFTEAVLNKGGRCMNILKNDKKMIRQVAEEIGLKE